MWESESSDMTSVGHCGLEELVPILKRTIGEEQEFWVASPTSKILKMTQTHFTFSTLSLSLVVRTYINWLWGKQLDVLFKLCSCHKRKKCACVSCICPVFFAVTLKLLLRSWLSLSVTEWWRPTKFPFLMNYTNRRSSDSTSPGQHMIIIIITKSSISDLFDHDIQIVSY